jgi:hypothetical protein
LWRRPRPKLGCGAKERRRKKDVTLDLYRILETMRKVKVGGSFK